MGGRAGVWAGADFIWSKNALVQRRIQIIHVPLHYLLVFTSIFPLKANRFEWIDALAAKRGEGVVHGCEMGEVVAQHAQGPHPAGSAACAIEIGITAADHRHQRTLLVLGFKHNEIELGMIQPFDDLGVNIEGVGKAAALKSGDRVFLLGDIAHRPPLRKGKVID